jgi:molybdopterin converting factor small subunit
VVTLLLVVTVTFYGPLQRWAGKTTFQSSGETIRQVFDNLEAQIGKSLLDHLTNPKTGLIKSHFHVLLNGKDVELMDGFEQQVSEGDNIVCVPPVGGG